MPLKPGGLRRCAILSFFEGIKEAMKVKKLHEVALKENGIIKPKGFEHWLIANGFCYTKHNGKYYIAR